MPGYLIAVAEGGHGEWWTPFVWTVLVAVIMMVLLGLAVPGSREDVPKKALTRLAEHVYLFIENMCVGVIGPHGKRYVPLVFTIYLTILISNLFGVFGLFAPTSSLGVTFGMAVMVVIYVQYEGIKSNGFVGYVKHFFGPPLGAWYLIPVTLLLFVIEVVSETAKMLSLSLRLFGNIDGEHKVSATLGSILQISDSFSVPFHAILLPLAVFVSIVQTLVFTMLTCVYLSLFTHHQSEHAHA